MLRRPLLVALAAAAAGAAVWIVAVQTAWGARLDGSILSGFTGLATARVKSVADVMAALVDPLPFALLCALVAGIPLVRRRPRHALVVLVMLAGANLTTQGLKLLLATPRPKAMPAGIHLFQTAWPSGHTTAALTLALCLVLVAPARLRPLAAAVGGVFVVAVVYSLMLLGYHYPSDVLGGFCVAVGWVALGVAMLRATGERGRAVAVELRAALTPAVLAGLALTALAVVAVLLRPESARTYLQDHTAFAAAAVMIGAAALTLSAGAAAALRRAR